MTPRWSYCGRGGAYIPTQPSAGSVVLVLVAAVVVTVITQGRLEADGTRGVEHLPTYKSPSVRGGMAPGVAKWLPGPTPDPAGFVWGPKLVHNSTICGALRSMFVPFGTAARDVSDDDNIAMTASEGDGENTISNRSPTTGAWLYGEYLSLRWLLDGACTAAVVLVVVGALQCRVWDVWKQVGGGGVEVVAPLSLGGHAPPTDGGG